MLVPEQHALIPLKLLCKRGIVGFYFQLEYFNLLYSVYIGTLVCHYCVIFLFCALP